jgi:hypothetical protein
MDKEEGGGQVFIVVEKSSEARRCAPSLIKQPLNPRGQTVRLRLLNIRYPSIYILY